MALMKQLGNNVDNLRLVWLCDSFYYLPNSEKKLFG
jgi:hypothetical protein